MDNSVAVTGALHSIIRSSLFLNSLYEFLFVLPHGSTGTKLVRDNGFDVRELGMLELSRSLKSWVLYLPVLLRNVVRLKKIVRKERIDLIVSNDFYNLLPAFHNVLGGRTPYVTYVRFMPSRFPKVLLKVWLGIHKSKSKEIICVSQAVRRELGIERTLPVVPNEIPWNQDDRSFDCDTVVFFPANYTRGKGHLMMLNVFAQVAQQCPGWTLRFAGDTMGLRKNEKYKNELKDWAEQLGIASRVEWLGHQDNMAQEYGKASIVTMFSESESFSMVCLEACYFQRAVIATRCGGPQEIIVHGQSGFLVDTNDVAAATHYLAELMNNQELRNSMGRRGKELVLQKSDIQLVAGQLGNIYQEALSQ